MAMPSTTTGAMQERMPSARPCVMVSAEPSTEASAIFFVGL